MTPELCDYLYSTEMMIETVIVFLGGQQYYSYWIKKRPKNFLWVQIGEISITSVDPCQLAMTENEANYFAGLS